MQLLLVVLVVLLHRFTRAGLPFLFWQEMLDPFTDPPTKLKEKDIIPLRSDGTGFSSKTDLDALKVTKAAPAARF